MTRNAKFLIISLFLSINLFSTELIKETKKIAFITAIYGAYEASCKSFVSQTIPCDFICFTDSESIISNGWLIDLHPYHQTHPNPIDNGLYNNSIINNSHTFNIAKYYKQSFQLIPKLQKYDIIVWLDGTIEITNPNTAKWITQMIEQYSIIGQEHEYRSGSLSMEVENSKGPRYASTFWFNQHQPYQNVDNQYACYIKDGYDENYWKKIAPERPGLGVWITCFLAFDNKNKKITELLNLWYLQTLKYTTQDQISFPYVLQKLNIIPYTLPDEEIGGKGHSITDFYIRHNHGI